MSKVKPNYREILRLSSKGLSQQDIATSVAASKSRNNSEVANGPFANIIG